LQLRLREMIELVPGETSRWDADTPLRGVLLAAHGTAPMRRPCGLSGGPRVDATRGFPAGGPRRSG
jgi:hypothetical protein